MITATALAVVPKAVVVKCKDTITKYVDHEAKKAGMKPPYKEAFESWQVAEMMADFLAQVEVGKRLTGERH
jgi:hypothetical protein